jgi:hypothetical protein
MTPTANAIEIDFCLLNVVTFMLLLFRDHEASNAALERLAHATTNKGYSPPLHA